MASMPMPSATTECVQEEACMKQLSTLCITNKNSIPAVGADLNPAIAEMESAATERSGEEKEETCDSQNANVTNKRKNKNAVPVKTSDLVKNNSKGNGSECVQDGIETKNFDTQISTVSMDGGVQNGDSMVFQGRHYQGLDPVPRMCELKEPTVDTGFCSNQETQDYSRYNTSKTESVLTRGGDGGFNVFNGGSANVRQLTLSSLSASDLVQDVGSVPSRDTNHAPTSAGGNIYVLPGGNLQVGSIQGAPGPASDSCFGDAVIFNAEVDSKVACEFKRHLEEDSGCDNVKADMFGQIDSNMSQYGSLETMLERYRYAYVIVTSNLKKDNNVIGLLENLDADAAWGRQWKKNRLVPVWLSEDKSVCPMVLKRLQGLKYYNREKGGALGQMYLDGLKNQMEEVRKKSPDWERQMKQDGK